jgi:hypothetical protein
LSIFSFPNHNFCASCHQLNQFKHVEDSDAKEEAENATEAEKEKKNAPRLKRRKVGVS